MRAFGLLVLTTTLTATWACNALVGNDEHGIVAPPLSVDDGGGGVVAPDAGSVSTDADVPPDASGFDAADGGESGSPGGAVPPTSGGIYTVGRAAGDAGSGVLPDGGIVAVFDDGFEVGETRCNGATCITGGITP